MNGVNIVLDFFFVLQLGWGVEGVAINIDCRMVIALGLWLVRDGFNVVYKNWIHMAHG